MMIICPLCLAKSDFDIFPGPDKRVYRCCYRCRLIFTGTRYRLSKKEEEQRYRQHRNGKQYARYVKFLEQALTPTLPFLSATMQGLDYGCGPESTISQLLQEQGIACEHYDPIFFPVELNNTYDFIFATECFEHFFLPAKEIQQIKSLLKPGGTLTIMTECWRTPETFKSWYYAKDPTHVSFYNNTTFEYICSKFGFTILHTDNHRVAILQKQPDLAESFSEQETAPEKTVQL